METVLLVVHLMLAFALVCVILVQRTAQDGGGLTGGGSTMGGLFTARGSANLLTRTTAILAGLFILTSLSLGILASNHHKTTGSIADQIGAMVPAPAAVPADAVKSDAAKTESKPAEAPKAPVAPEVPVSK